VLQRRTNLNVWNEVVGFVTFQLRQVVCTGLLLNISTFWARYTLLWLRGIFEFDILVEARALTASEDIAADSILVLGSFRLRLMFISSFRVGIKRGAFFCK